jgi:hypothetical protein
MAIEGSDLHRIGGDAPKRPARYRILAQGIRDQLFPIRAPVARTSPPPSITLAAAEIGGVSMYFH